MAEVDFDLENLTADQVATLQPPKFAPLPSGHYTFTISETPKLGVASTGTEQIELTLVTDNPENGKPYTMKDWLSFTEGSQWKIGQFLLSVKPKLTGHITGVQLKNPEFLASLATREVTADVLLKAEKNRVTGEIQPRSRITTYTSEKVPGRNVPGANAPAGNTDLNDLDIPF